MKAISYIRFSTKTQSKGSSLDRQNNYINHWLQQNPLVDLSDLTYQDLGVSGYSGKHIDSELGQLLEAIEAGKIVSGDYILIESMDRLGRLHELDMFSLIQQITKNGIKIVTLEDGTEYSTESISKNSGILFQLAGKVQMAHKYSEQLSTRLKAAWVKKTEDAKDGKGVKRKTPFWLTWNEVTKRNDIVSDENKAILTSVFNMFLKGLGERRIMNVLREKYPEKFATSDPATVKKWLVNKTAIGYWREIPKVYPAAITETLFYQVQDALNKRGKMKSQTAKSGHVLCGVVKCSECGGNYSMRSHANSNDTMACSRALKRKDQCTNNRTIPLLILEELFVPAYDIFKDALITLSETKAIDDDLIVIDGELADIDKQITNLVDSLALIGINDAIQEKMQELVTRKEELQTNRIQVTQSVSHLTVSDVVNYDIVNQLRDIQTFNKLLIDHGFEINVLGKKITANGITCEYIKLSRKDKLYHIKTNNQMSTIPCDYKPLEFYANQTSIMDELLFNLKGS